MFVQLHIEIICWCCCLLSLGTFVEVSEDHTLTALTNKESEEAVFPFFHGRITTVVLIRLNLSLKSLDEYLRHLQRSIRSSPVHLSTCHLAFTNLLYSTEIWIFLALLSVAAFDYVTGVWSGMPQATVYEVH